MFYTNQWNEYCSLWMPDREINGISSFNWWDLIVFVFGNSTQTHDKTAKPVVCRSDQCFGWCWPCSLQSPIFASRKFVVCVWKQRSSDQDDFLWEKSHNETCFQNPGIFYLPICGGKLLILAPIFRWVFFFFFCLFFQVADESFWKLFWSDVEKHWKILVSQFNRIWNHLVGYWTEIEWFTRSGTVGCNCFCSWKCFQCFKWFREIRECLTTKWMWWKTLMLFFRISNAHVKNFFLQIMIKAEARHWDTFPEPTELLLIGCSMKSSWSN